MLRKFPIFEQVFEHKVNIRRWNLCQDMTSEIEEFIKKLPKEKIQSLLDTADLACEGTVIGFSSTRMSYGIPINMYDSKSAGAESYRKLAKEIVGRKDL